MAEPNTFFNRLTRLFKSGPAMQRRVKGIDAKSFYSNQLVKGNNGYRASAPFGFGRENSPFSVLGSYGILDRMARYSEFGEMEYCLHGDTKIAIPGGYKTIKELAEEYGLEQEFVVYSYDHNKQQLVPALGKQARKTRTDHSWKVTFDNGQEIIGTDNHRLMKRDGTYVEIKDLAPGDAMMPFYRKALFTEDKQEKDGEYLFVYSMDKDSSRNGWVAEHKLIAEWADRPLKENEVVHHVNFCKSDNNPENLSIMDKTEHISYHATELNGRKWSSENSEWIKAFKQNHSTWMRENNPAKRNDITFGRILEFCENNSFNLYKTARAFDTDPNVIKRRLKENGFDSFVVFAKAYKRDWKSDSWDNRGSQNPRFNNAVTFARICEEYKKGTSQKALASKMGVSVSPIASRLKEYGYDSWSSFTQGYNNMKVASIEYHGEIDLYDLTVDGYKNFATDTVISHNTPEVATALDIYADEVVGGDDKGKCFHIYSDNAEIKKHLEDLFYDILNVEFNLRAWTRNLVKYGDFFLLNEVLPDIGVVNVVPIPVNELEREEGYDMEDPYAVRFKWLTRGNKYLENWQVSHFRVLGNDLFLPYGTSVLEPARRIWRQLIMLEDAMLTYRVVRSPERRVFYIDVGNIAPNDVPNYMEAAKSALNSRGQVDKEQGREDQRFYSPTILDDYYIPVRGGASNTRVETLTGGQHVTATEDVEYIQKKMFAALKVPKPYMNFDENLSAKASLAQMDIRFSRTIQTFQKIMVAELNKLAMIHLFSIGFDATDLINFEIKLSNPSSVALQQRLELWSAKFEVAGAAKESMLVDEDWIQKGILDLTPDEIESINYGLKVDKLKAMEIELLEPVLPNPQQQPKTTDIFDPSNYDVPGSSDVPREVPVEATDSPEHTNNHAMANYRSYDAEGNPYTVDLSKGKSPIKATPFLTKHKRDRKRRVGQGGRSNLQLPDFKTMVSANNKYAKDVHGQYTEATEAKRSDRRTFGDLDEYAIKVEPMLSREMKRVFSKFTSMNTKAVVKDKMLSESLDNDIEEFEIELSEADILIETAFAPETTENEGEPTESIDEKTLTEVFNTED